MWMFLQYLRDIGAESLPWIYAVIIVTVLVLILSTAVGIEP